MYSIDDRDRVVPLDDVPSCALAELPSVVVCGQGAGLVYAAVWSDESFRDVPRASPEHYPVVLICVDACYACSHGPPNDKAMGGHPLAARGLDSCGAFEVEHSSWIRALERMNSVHPRHDPEFFRDFRHLIFTFEDVTFECACSGYEVERRWGTIEAVFRDAVSRVAGD